MYTLLTIFFLPHLHTLGNTPSFCFINNLEIFRFLYCKLFFVSFSCIYHGRADIRLPPRAWTGIKNKIISLRTNFTCLEFILQFYFVFLCVCRFDWRAWPVNWLPHNHFVHHNLHNSCNLNPFFLLLFLYYFFHLFFQTYNHIYILRLEIG